MILFIKTVFFNTLINGKKNNVKNTKDCLQFFLIITIIIIIITIKKIVWRQSLLFGKIFASLSSTFIGQKPEELRWKSSGFPVEFRWNSTGWIYDFPARF